MKRFLLIAAVAAVAVGVVIAGTASAKPQQPVAAAPQVPSVSLAEVSRVQSAPREEITGSLEPQKQLKLAFEISGRLSKIFVRKGASVGEGQLIAQLDPEMADAQVAQAEAAVKAAEAQAAMAQDGAERQEKLGSATTEMQLENSKRQALAAQAQLSAARAQLAQMRTLRKRHDLRAPFAGVIIDAPDQVGATVASNSSLFTLEQIDSLVLKLTVSDSARALLETGSRVQVSAIGTDARTTDAQVRLVIPSADAQTRRVPVEIVVPNQDRRFTAHTLGRAILPMGAASDALSLPASALSSSGGDHVYVVENNSLRKIPVEVVDRGADKVVVRAKANINAVVDYPAANLDDGAKVTVR
jgi:membrane fusion protein (multidrug efflux system)